MLLQFNFKNYKSFRDDTTLDLTATKSTEFDYHVVDIAKEKILPVAALYGANASGKSNVLEAFEYMTNYVIRSFEFGGESDLKKGESRFYKPTPFLFDSNSKSEESFFEVYFTYVINNHEKIYNYGFTIDNNGINEEWLNSKSKTAKEFTKIFHRFNYTIEFGSFPRKIQENIVISLQKESLIVSLGAKLKIDLLSNVRKWFYQNEFINFGEPLDNFIISNILPDDFDNDETVRKNVVDYLSTFDPSIIDFKVEVISNEDDDDEDIKVYAVHKNIDSNLRTAIPLKQESAGTLKMFALYPMLQAVLSNGSVLVIDELNSRLHPLLVRSFILSFIDKNINKNHAQLIFTSHDAIHLNMKLLRRDEIWFTEKNNNGVSELYSLADFSDKDGDKIRKDENYEKNYLLGKYGAIPILKSIDL